MKFLCLQCDEPMKLTELQRPGDQTMTVAFECASCGFEFALLANPMETQFVDSLDYGLGGRVVPKQPLELVRKNLADGRSDAFKESDAPSEAAAKPRQAVEWSLEARGRLEKVPSFARGMVKRIYTDYARERGIEMITPVTMDQARAELGLEDM